MKLIPKEKWRPMVPHEQKLYARATNQKFDNGETVFRSSFTCEEHGEEAVIVFPMLVMEQDDHLDEFFSEVGERGVEDLERQGCPPSHFESDEALDWDEDGNG